MFSRRWTLLIVGSWLFLTGWFLLRDLWPRVHADEPAPFAIALGDEPRISLTGTARQRLVEVPWLVIRNDVDRNAGSAALRVQYDQWSDTLEFQGEFKVRSLRRPGSPCLEVESTFRVNWDGQLQELDCEIRLRREALLLTNSALAGLVVGAWMPGLSEHVPQWPFLHPNYPAAGTVVGAWLPGLAQPVAPKPPLPELRDRYAATIQATGAVGMDPGRFRGPGGGRSSLSLTGRSLTDSPFNLYTDQEATARCRGRVRDGSLLPQWRVSGEQREPAFQPVDLSRRGHVLLPFQPLNRMPGVAAGQRWRVPLVDLEAALRLERNREVRQVRAEVGEPQAVSWQQRTVRAYPVTYHDGGQELVRVWVRQSDALVIRQEISFSSDRYTLERMRDR